MTQLLANWQPASQGGQMTKQQHSNISKRLAKPFISNILNAIYLEGKYWNNVPIQCQISPLKPVQLLDSVGQPPVDLYHELAIHGVVASYMITYTVIVTMGEAERHILPSTVVPV